MKSLELPKLSSRRPQHLLIDASGVKIVGEGEWKVKVHGKGKHRQSIKIHVGVDEKTQEIMAVKVTESNISDCKVVEELLKSCPKTIKKVSADGAYDGFPTRKLLHDQGIEGLITPPSNAKIRREKAMLNRNDFLSVWTVLGGDKPAKKLARKLLGYTRRSLVETSFSRIKGVFDD